MEERDDILVKYVSDQLAAEHHTLDVVASQLGDEDLNDFPQAKEILERIKLVLKEHVTHLQQHLEQDLQQKGGTLSSKVKVAVTEVTGTIIGLYNKIRTEKVSKMLRDDYTALSMCSLTYTMLHATALALKSEKTARIALEHLNHLPKFVIELNSVIPSVVVEELGQRGIVLDFQADEKALAESQEAWRVHRPETQGKTAAF